MSSALAIAAVSYLLRDLLNDGIVNNLVGTALESNVKVTASPPLRDAALASGQCQLNLFLYHVTANAAWRNAALPSRDLNGTRVTNPPLALDLHYLVTAYDERDFHSEALLGYVAQLLHENPGFSRDQIGRSLRPGPGGVYNGVQLPAALQNLETARLADQVETIRIVPQYLTTEEMFKIWTGFQAPYRPSLAYQVSTVLIQSERSVRTALPVLTRGPGDRGPVVQPSRVPAVPTLLAVLPAARQPAAAVGGKVKLFGHHLRGTDLEVTFSHAQLDTTFSLAASDPDPAVELRPPDPLGLDTAERSLIPRDADACLVIDLSKVADPVSAGWYAVSIAVRLSGDGQRLHSNALTLAIAPGFVPADPAHPGAPHAPVVARDADGRCEVTLTCAPSLAEGQTASLILGEHELQLESQLAEDAVRFVGRVPDPGSYPARLRVDGVESLFLLRPDDGPPSFDERQKITVP